MAINILVNLWNRLGEFVVDNNYIYRAGLCYFLGGICYRGKDFGQAIWWLLHAHADDTLGTQPGTFHRGGAYDFLQLAFGVPDKVFEYMQKCKEQNAKGKKPHTLFAEHLVMQLSLKPEFAHLFSHPTAQSSYPISTAYARCLNKRVNTKVRGGEQENSYDGKALEELARYLILLMPGWIPTMNKYHHDTDIDSDLIARYVREPEAISSAHPRAVLIECKNRSDALSVAEAGYFLYRMTLTQVEVGVLFVRKITGDSADMSFNKNASRLLDLAFQQNGKAVVVIRLDEIEDVIEGRKTIWTLIDSGIVQRRFGEEKKNE